MAPPTFLTPAGRRVPAVTAAEMQQVDRVATEEFGLSLGRMMEHAGRNLARAVMAFEDCEASQVAVLAGNGGNGGGGLACARHLATRGRLEAVALDREPSEITGTTAIQLDILERMGVPIQVDEASAIREADLVVDALVGYGLSGAPRGSAAALIEHTAATDSPVVSLDVPSGVDATTGETPGVAVDPARTLTLALPKTGLSECSGSLWLGDLGIPPAVYDAAGIEYSQPFGESFIVELVHNDS